MRNVRTAIAANGSLPAAPLPDHGDVANIAVTSAAATTHTVGSDTQLIVLHPDCAIYVAVGTEVDAEDMDLAANSYAAYAVKPGSTIALRAVTGAGNVKIMEA
ncbi:hypothetical protein [Pleomorphomonas carboxyditropha]|uniref:Uncharacterized protein n=1 Tax=Pleomorphomonas carboxyditropha TaxID=2023338 RepID=A0A2G9X155_9HYPH|nr:hypothetical protein [Pleomorphomonas carboxyditropha]PIP00676.1 hypothetical protein CJ014_00805 [Pleomorphomonas carboxyditropha]